MATTVWFITGVSAGLGNLLALRALEEGHRVVGSVRNKQKSAAALLPLEEKGAKIIEMDSTESQESIFQKVRQAVAIFGHIDILVNNAGYAALGPLEYYSEDEVVRQIRTNTLGPLFIAQAVLPSMRARKTGTIVNMSSFVGIRGDAANGVYALSKFALEGWTESLSKEVAEFGIVCLIAEFGAFRTGFLDAFNAPAQPIVPGYEGSFAQETFAAMRGYSGRQPGDPKKGIEHLFEVVMAGGKVNGEKVLRVPIGGDAVEVVTDKLNGLKHDLELGEEWERTDSTAIVE